MRNQKNEWKHLKRISEAIYLFVCVAFQIYFFYARCIQYFQGVLFYYPPIIITLFYKLPASFNVDFKIRHILSN